MPKRTTPAKSNSTEPVLLSGGNPQIAEGDGDAPVQAYVAAMPGWTRDVGRDMDALIERTVPNVCKAVRCDGPGRIYVVEPTGDVEDDPNVTNTRFRGNPTKSFRSRAPLRVRRGLDAWTGHAPEAVGAMRAGLAKLEREGVEPEDTLPG